jgi:cytochrome P450
MEDIRESHHSFAFLRNKHITVFIGFILGAVRLCVIIAFQRRTDQNQAILHCVVTCLYNVYFHPLRKCSSSPLFRCRNPLTASTVPGPKLAAATGLVFFYKLMSGEEVSWETEMHKKYGEIVRLGPDRLSYITPQAWKDIAGPGIGKRLENTKDMSTFGPDMYGMRSMGSQPDMMVHRSQRRVFAPAFSDKALKLQEPLILGYLNALVRIVRNNATSGAAFDLAKSLNCMTFDVMADLAFGEPLGLLDQSELTPWVQAIFGNVQKMSISRLAREYKTVGFLIRALTPKEVIEGAHFHYNHSYERVEKRLERGIDIGKPDIWRLAMEKTDDTSDLSKRQMTANAQSFMLAGTETTATLLSGLTFLLLKHPHYMQRLQDEVRALQKEELTLENMARLPFLNACIHEALRVYPPAPIALFRITPKGGNMICGEWIPGGVSTSQRDRDCLTTDYRPRPAWPSHTLLPITTLPTSEIPTLLCRNAGSRDLATTATAKMHSTRSQSDRAIVSVRSKSAPFLKRSQEHVDC